MDAAKNGSLQDNQRAWLSRGMNMALAIVGPASVAAAHFIQSMVLLHRIPQAAFGSFAFLLGLAALSWTAWQAVFCAPLAQAVHAAGAGGAQSERVAGSANLLTAAAMAPVFFLVAMLVGLDPGPAFYFGTFGVVSLARWFGRAQAYVHDRQMRAVASDALYSITLIASLGMLVFSGHVSVTGAYASMTVSALVGLAPFGRDFVKASTSELFKRPLRRWLEVTQSRAHWSLAAVACGELAANAHAYVVMIFAGATAYAPIAATALLVRPVTFASVAMRDVERPRLARLIERKDFSEAQRSINWARGSLASAWLSSGAVVAMLLWWNPHLVFPASYDRGLLIKGSALWMAVSGLALLRVPETALLQAVGKFREIAAATAQAAVVSIFCAFALVLAVGPIWSIAAIFAGQVVNAFRIARICRAWRREHMPENSTTGPTSPAAAADTITELVGAPGSGKSTLLSTLREQAGISVMTVPSTKRLAAVFRGLRTALLLSIVHRVPPGGFLRLARNCAAVEHAFSVVRELHGNWFVDEGPLRLLRERESGPGAELNAWRAFAEVEIARIKSRLPNLRMIVMQVPRATHERRFRERDQREVAHRRVVGGFRNRLGLFLDAALRPDGGANTLGTFIDDRIANEDCQAVRSFACGGDETPDRVARRFIEEVLQNRDFDRVRPSSS